MNEISADSLKSGYFGVAAVVIALFAWNGWREGVFRQAGAIVAIVSAYAAAWFGATSVGPLFGFLHFPPQLLNVIGGMALGLVTLIGLRSLSGLVFSRTAEQRPGSARTSYGVFGAVLGLAFGGVLFMLASDAIRALGGLAQTNVALAKKPQLVLPGVGALPPVEQPGVLVRGLAKLSGALDADGSGKFFQSYDPVPTHAYASIVKLGLMVSNAEALDRFLSYPGIEELSHHPKIVALREDASISEIVATGSYLKLLRHERVIALASDEEFARKLKAMKFDEAMDFALKGTVPTTPDGK